MLDKKYFIFTTKNNIDVHSSDIGSIVTKPVVSRATRVINHILVIGRNGTLTEDTKAYNNTEINFRLMNYKANIIDNEVIGLLDGQGGELQLSWMRGKYKVKAVNSFTISEEVPGAFNIDISFICEPFRYLEEEVITITEKGTNIFTDGNYGADHITTIYGSGDISLLINDEQIVLKDVVDYITIDTARLICYKGNTPTNNKMIGEFIKLKAYVNTISWIGTVNKVEIKYRGRFLN